MTKKRKRKSATDGGLVSCQINKNFQDPSPSVDKEKDCVPDCTKDSVNVRVTESPTLSESVVLELINSFKFK